METLSKPIELNRLKVTFKPVWKG